jgi:hypothetical protein
MFKLQVIMLSWDRKEAEQAVGAAAAVLQALEQQGAAASPAYVALLKLQFTMLQVRGPAQQVACDDAYAFVAFAYCFIYQVSLHANCMHVRC